MGYFVKQLFIFLLPLGLILVFPLVIIFLGREYYSGSDAVRFQAQHPDAIVGMAYSRFYFDYKKRLISEKKPTVFSLGTSRTQEFREEFFIDSSRFVTASNGAETVDEMTTFIKELPRNNSTKLVIVALEPDIFRSSWSKEMPIIREPLLLPITLLRKWRSFYMDYFSGKFSLRGLWKNSWETNNIGLRAIMNEDGFRKDGSFQWKEFVSPNESAIKENLKIAIDSEISGIKIKRNTSVNKEPLSLGSIASLENFLNLCRKKNIQVIGFLPPVPPDILKEIMSVDDTYKKRTLQFPKVLGRIFSDNGFEYYDLSDVSTFGGTENEFADQVHGTDKLYLRMVIYMAERNKDIGSYVDLSKNRRLLESISGDFIRDYRVREEK